jgi:hypothetical protein
VSLRRAVYHAKRMGVRVSDETHHYHDSFTVTSRGARGIKEALRVDLGFFFTRFFFCLRVLKFLLEEINVSGG